MDRMTGVELMGDTEIGEREFAVQGMVARSAVTLFSAKKGRNKSVLALNMAHMVAMGREFLGRPTMQGQVLYLGLEDDKIELRRRYGLLLKNLTSDPCDDLDLVDDWPLQREGGVEKVAEWCEAQDNPVMVIVDVLAYVAPELITVRGGWARVLDRLKPWKKLASDYNIALVLVTHSLRGADFVENPVERVQGSGALTAYVHTVMVAQGKEGETERQLDWGGKFSKGKLALTLDGGTMACSLRDAPPAENKADQETVRQRILGIVRMYPGQKARQYARMMPDRSVISTEKMLELMTRDEELIKRANRTFVAPDAAAAAPLRSASVAERTAAP